MPHGCFGFLGDIGHGANTIQWVVSLCCFSAKHDAICTIQDGIGNIRTFSASGTGLSDHRLEHLCGANDGFAGLVAFSNHALLGQKDFLGRDFDTKITASDHDTIRCFDNFIQIVNTLMVFNLGNDENVTTLFTYLKEWLWSRSSG